MNTTTQTDNLIGPDKVMDVRPIPCSIKHGLIIRTWLDLPVGDHFILLNDHDPIPLYYQFAAQWPETFNRENLVKGPDDFRVRVTKLKALAEVAESAPSCCGDTDVKITGRKFSMQYLETPGHSQVAANQLNQKEKG